MKPKNNNKNSVLTARAIRPVMSPVFKTAGKYLESKFK